MDASAWGPELGDHQATVNRLEGFLSLDRDHGAAVPKESGIVGENGVLRARFRVDGLPSGEDRVGHQASRGTQ